MASRIQKHRAERPNGWQTLEIQRGVGRGISSLQNQPAIVLLDCLTLLVSNLVSPMEEPIDEDMASALVEGEVRGLLETYRASKAQWFIISNEVGLGLVPPYPLGRVYRDLLGRANQLIAMEADEVLFMVAGIPMKVK
jgi:adenosylcobinamide kinase/adenosylcobinamide-phosphate guanylyltransferase